MGVQPVVPRIVPYRRSVFDDNDLAGMIAPDGHVRRLFVPHDADVRRILLPLHAECLGDKPVIEIYYALVYFGIDFVGAVSYDPFSRKRTHAEIIGATMSNVQVPLELWEEILDAICVASNKLEFAHKQGCQEAADRLIKLHKQMEGIPLTKTEEPPGTTTEVKGTPSGPKTIIKYGDKTIGEQG